MVLHWLHEKIKDPLQFPGCWVESFHLDQLKEELPLLPQYPSDVALKNSMGMLHEEYTELVYALEAKDLVEIIDGAADMIYVLQGLILQCGVSPDLIGREVAYSNFEKEHDPTHPEKPVRKPEGWEPPRIREILEYLRKNKPV